MRELDLEMRELEYQEKMADVQIRRKQAQKGGGWTDRAADAVESVGGTQMDSYNYAYSGWRLWANLGSYVLAAFGFALGLHGIVTCDKVDSVDDDGKPVQTCVGFPPTASYGLACIGVAVVLSAIATLAQMAKHPQAFAQRQAYSFLRHA